MVILEDTRQQIKKHDLKHQWFEKNGIKIERCRLYVGDYTLANNQSICIDTKKDLQELCIDVCQDHERFRNELVRAMDANIKLIILCEHGHGIKCLEDVIFWQNPRRKIRQYVDGKWQTFETKAMRGEHLYKILNTQSERYGVQFEFCDPIQTGRRIVELFGGYEDDG
jgi:hypothetical protein